jgi:hypothetical protein
MLRFSRVIAAVVVTVVLVPLLVTGTAASAQARAWFFHNATAGEILKSFNQDRRESNVPAVKSNVWLQDYANAYLKHLVAIHGGSYVTPPNTFLPLDDGSSVDVMAESMSRSLSYLDKEYGVGAPPIATLLRVSTPTGATQAKWTYGAFAIKVTSTKVYAVMVLADYTSPPPGKITTAKPTISGTARVGQALKASHGSWSPSGLTYSYSWQVDGEEVSTATSYVPTVADIGKLISVEVGATKPGYVAASTRFASAQTVKHGYLKKGKVTVAGNRNVGETLTAMPGTWAPVDTAFTYQWLRSGKAIVGETNNTYNLTVADYGKKIDVKVTGSATAYSTASVTTHTSTTTKHPLLDVASTPVIVGDPTYKQVLTVDVGDWQPAPVTLTYQWRINGKAVYKATKPTFTVPSSAVGKAITVTVKGSHTGYSSVYRTSEPTELVASIPFAVEGVVTVTGTHAVGKKLTAHRGTWSPSASYSYRWYRDDVSISGATASTYTVTSKSAGHTLTVKVTAKRAGYTTTTSTSDEIAIP